MKITPLPAAKPQSSPVTASPPPSPAPAAPQNPEVLVRPDPEGVVIPLYSERLQLGTREIREGAVRLRKVVRTETINEPITLRHEELVIERLVPDEAGDGPGTWEAIPALQQPFAGQTITIPLSRQEPVIQTEIVRSGDVVARRNLVTEPATVGQDLPNESVEIVKLGETENVSIAPEVRPESNLTDRVPQVAEGKAPQFETATAESAEESETISSLATLAGPGDLRALAGRPVELKNISVHEILNIEAFTIAAPDGKVFLVRTASIPADLVAGDSVELRGRVLPAAAIPASTPGLQPAGTRQPIFIDATMVKRIRGT